MEEQKYTIAEEFELPSKGLIYDKEVNSKIKLRSMTMRDEMKRTSRTDSPNVLLADLIEGCMLEKPAIHVADMCLGDFEYLLHKLRVVSYGEKYDMTSVCYYCGTVNDISFNLDDEEVLDFNIDEFNDSLKVTLPSSGKEVKLKFSTPRMLDLINNKTQEASKKDESNLDFSKYFKISESIETVNGAKLGYAQKENFIKSLDVKDAQKLIKSIDKLNDMIGTKRSITYTCSNPKCREENLTFFRYTTEFFEPSNY